VYQWIIFNYIVLFRVMKKSIGGLHCVAHSCTIVVHKWVWMLGYISPLFLCFFQQSLFLFLFLDTIFTLVLMGAENSKASNIWNMSGLKFSLYHQSKVVTNIIPEDDQHRLYKFWYSIAAFITSVYLALPRPCSRNVFCCCCIYLFVGSMFVGLSWQNW